MGLGYTGQVRTQLTAKEIEAIVPDAFGSQVFQVEVHWNNPTDTDDGVEVFTKDGVRYFGTVQEREGDSLIIEIDYRADLL
jgi:hypothetical protein